MKLVNSKDKNSLYEFKTVNNSNATSDQIEKSLTNTTNSTKKFSIQEDPAFIEFSILTVIIVTALFTLICIVLFFCNKDLVFDTIKKIKKIFRKIFNSK